MDGKSVEISENQKNRNQKIVSNSSNEKPQSNRGNSSTDGSYILIANNQENPPEPVTHQEEESDKIKPETISSWCTSIIKKDWNSVSKIISNQDADKNENKTDLSANQNSEIENYKENRLKAVWCWFREFSELVPIQSWEPQGFPILFDQCYFNSVLQSLVSCEEFRKAMLSYKPSFLNISRDQNFVRGLSCLIRGLKNKNENKVRDALSTIQSNYTESAFGDDILKCFTNILNRISNVIGYNSQENPNSSTENIDKAEINFIKQKNRNQGFVFDNFYGQLGYQIICKRCKHVVNESFQVMKSLLLPIPNSSETVTLDMCIEEFFKESDIENDIPMLCKCDSGCSIDLELRTKMTHTPRYLFMYLNRGSYNNERKNETNVECKIRISITTARGEEVIYELISVIDHVGTNENGHYYCKCCYDGRTWWCLNDSNVRRMPSSSGVVCRDSIGFIFKKYE